MLVGVSRADAGLNRNGDVFETPAKRGNGTIETSDVSGTDWSVGGLVALDVRVFLPVLGFGYRCSFFGRSRMLSTSLANWLLPSKFNDVVPTGELRASQRNGRADGPARVCEKPEMPRKDKA